MILTYVLDDQLENAKIAEYFAQFHLRGMWILAKSCLLQALCGRCGGLMVSALVPGGSGPGLSPGRGHRAVFLGKTLNSHSASLHRGV